jgi:RND superfamily putative drug exporter
MRDDGSILGRLGERVGARPKRALLATLAFVIVAGVVGGPVAGALEDSGGFNTDDSGSARAVDRIEAATGMEKGPAVVLLVDGTAG